MGRLIFCLVLAIFCVVTVVLILFAMVGMIDDIIDETVIQASETYENNCIDEDDSLFLLASLEYESGQSSSSESQSNESACLRFGAGRFSTPVSGEEVSMVIEEGVATKT